MYKSNLSKDPFNNLTLARQNELLLFVLNMTGGLLFKSQAPTRSKKGQHAVISSIRICFSGMLPNMQDVRSFSAANCLSTCPLVSRRGPRSAYPNMLTMASAVHGTSPLTPRCLCDVTKFIANIDPSCSKYSHAHMWNVAEGSLGSRNQQPLLVAVELLDLWVSPQDIGHRHLDFAPDAWI